MKIEFLLEFLLFEAETIGEVFLFVLEGQFLFGYQLAVAYLGDFVTGVDKFLIILKSLFVIA
ncbi:MAG: hypothetical protein H6574_12270 [Lewinellaceae bacterium]|nr:hypothetical protein [Lewinellaceae bacterium]